MSSFCLKGAFLSDFERFWVCRSPVPSIISLISRTVNGNLKILQIRSKNRFWGKRTTIYYRVANLTLIYIGQADGKSNTFTIKWQSIKHRFCGPSMQTHQEFQGIPPPPPPGGGVNVSMIMNNYIHTWVIWLAGQ